MSNVIQCFWIDPTDRATVSLRRYARVESAPCPGKYGYHNAHTPIGECGVWSEPLASDPQHTGWRFEIKDGDVPADDPRWPVKCEYCEYRFTENDTRQVFERVIYQRLDTCERMTLEEAPPGAMYDADWLRGFKYKDRGDGIVLMVLCPDRCHGGTYAWNVDGPSSNGNGWERTGIAKSANPTVTATPSIGCGEGMRCYHGWLRNGTLVSV